MAILHQIRQSKYFTLTVVCLSAFTDTLIYGLIVPVLPFMLEQRIKIPTNHVQIWNSILLGSFGAAIAIGSVIFGWIADRMTSRRFVFLLGLVLLAASTVLFAVAESIAVLEIARIIQGLSSAVCNTIGSALLVDRFGSDNIAEATGYKSASLTLGFLIGPLVGGTLYQVAGYVATFIPAMALIVLEGILRTLIVEPAPENGKEDSYALDPMMASKDEEAPSEETDTESNPDSSSGDDDDDSVTKSKRFQPLKKSSLWVMLTTPRFVSVNVLILVLNSFSGAFESVLPMYAHELFGMESLAASLLFLPLSIPLLLGPLFGRLVDKHGSKRAAMLSHSIIALAFLLMGLIIHDTKADIVFLVVLLFLYSLAYTAAVPALIKDLILTLKELEEKDPSNFSAQDSYGQAFGLNNAAFALGVVAGTLYGGVIRQFLGWQLMTVAMAALAFVSVGAIKYYVDRSLIS